MGGWMYQKHGESVVGPLSESDFMLFHDGYDLPLDALVKHPVHTHGEWNSVERVPLYRRLRFAAAVGNLAVKQVRQLIADGATTDEIEGRTEDDLDQHTVLMELVSGKGERRLEIAQLLIDAGAKIDAQRSDGLSALFWAAIDGTPEMVQLLIDNGATVDLDLGDGETVLSCAVRHGRPDTAEVLLRAGADPSRRIGDHNDATRRNKNAIDLAKDSGNRRLIALFDDAQSSSSKLQGTPTDELITRLDLWLKSNRPDYCGGLLPGLTDEEWADCESDYGARLPAALKTLYQWRNGQQSRELGGLVREYNWMPIEAVLSLWRDAFDDFDADAFPNWWNPNWLPIFENGHGDDICLDMAGCFGGQPGQIVVFEHETDTRDILYPSIEAWLEMFVRALEAGEWSDEPQSVTSPLNDLPYPDGYPIRASASDS